MNDVNSDFEILRRASTNIPDKAILTEEQIEELLRIDEQYSTFRQLTANVPFDAVANYTTTNSDGSMKADELTTFVKGYDFSTGQVSDFPDNLEKVLVVGMVRDKSVQQNARSFFIESETLYQITDVKVSNNKRAASELLNIGDTLDLEFTINFKITADAINVKYYDDVYTTYRRRWIDLDHHSHSPVGRG